MNRGVFTCSDYPRYAELFYREEVKSELGVDWQLGSRPGVIERVMTDPTISGGEGSLAAHVMRVSRGDDSFIGIPVFVQRQFTSQWIYARHKGGLGDLKEIRNLRIGMYSWTATGTIWFRHFLRFLGVDLELIDWTVGSVNVAGPLEFKHARQNKISTSLEVAAQPQKLTDMLVTGAIDLLLSPVTPIGYNSTHGPIFRFSENCQSADLSYLTETGIFPPQHLMIVSKSAYSRDPTLCKRMLNTFASAEERFIQRQSENAFTLPWEQIEIDAMASRMIGNPYSHGFMSNRNALDTFLDIAFNLGVLASRPPAEQLFASECL